MPTDWKRYPKDWKEIAKACKDKAGWQCERCGVKHGATRVGSNGKEYKVIMTTAHIGPTKHNKMDVDNLECLCQRCHLKEDREDHIHNAKQTRKRKKLQKQPLLRGMPINVKE